MTIKTTVAAICFFSITACLQAVTSNMTEFRSGADFAQGDPNGVVINSSGKITLNRDWQLITEKFDDVWTINSIVTMGNDTFIGTSPNGAIFKVSGEVKEKIYNGEIKIEEQADPNENEKSADEESETDAESEVDDEQVEEATQEQEVSSEPQFSNEHIFAMTSDSKGHLIAGVSGEDCRLLKFSKNAESSETIFELTSDSFIFAMEKDSENNIYVATGPVGNIYKISSDLKEKELLCKVNERNVISLKIDGDTLYAGCDKRGILYKIELDGSKPTVLYDSAQTDITSIEVDDAGNVYATTTGLDNGANGMGDMGGMPPMNMPFGSEDDEDQDDENEGDQGGQFSAEQGGLRLSIAATKPNKQKQPVGMMNGQPQNGPQSAVYKISPDGISNTLIQSGGIFLDANLVGGKLIVGTGNNGKLISVETNTHFQSSVYEDNQSSQVTSLLKTGKGILVGLSNPARLIMIADGYKSDGYWVSNTIDAGQPAIWGKVQLEAQIPESCNVMISSRSGNIDDSENGEMSDWSQPVKASDATQIECPVARFAQIKIILNGSKDNTPTIRAIALANVVPNIAPVIRGIKTATSSPDAPKGLIAINVVSMDENNDPLVYKYEIKDINTKLWIEIEEEISQNIYKWNTLSVPDGIYEIKATVSDKNGNNPQSALEASWVSNPVTVDNNAPAITFQKIDIEGQTATIKLTIEDEYSVIGKIRYTVDSNDKWVSIIPDDMIYDTKEESFTIVADELEEGSHIVAVELTDALNNKKYKSFVVEIEK